MRTPILLLSLTFAVPAMAQVNGTATLSTPTTLKDRIVANGALWRCSGVTCSGTTSNDRFGLLHTCKDLAKKAGKVSSFAGPRGMLSTKDLDTCNKRAKSSA